MAEDIDNIEVLTTTDKDGYVNLPELPNLGGIAFNFSSKDELILYWNSHKNIKERTLSDIHHLFAIVDAVLNTLTIHGYNSKQGNKMTSPALKESTKFFLPKKNKLVPSYQELFNKKQIETANMVADVTIYDNGALIQLRTEPFKNNKEKKQLFINIKEILQRDLNLTYDEQATGLFDDTATSEPIAVKVKSKLTRILNLLPEISVKKLPLEKPTDVKLSPHPIKRK